MKTLGNILWFLLTGLVSALSWIVLGIFWCITIIGIPFGKQCFKLAGLSLFPFGKTVNTNFGKHPIANIIWIIFGGLELALGFIIAGVFWCITIIGIPFGKQCFKLASLAIAPFGANVTK
ncbi:MAG: YccF domain-containing protein [Clostridia bacterium]|nr:YccF domain-containing protein [Clostridia bacterium]